MSNNIKVAIRVRPLLPSDRNENIYWEVKDSNCISQVNGSDKFSFDRVYDGAKDNEEVYEDLCKPIVASVMHGFNATIFAYGQTSSGKTFTMTGKHGGIEKGVIQYAIQEIFDMIQQMPDREFLLRVSSIEIYKEKVYDLLSDKNDDLKLLEDTFGVVKVNGLQEKIVQTPDQIWDVMHAGQTKRHTGETQLNRASSRSHFIFRMILESSLKGDEDPIVNVSQLNLVDLAGSEDVKLNKTRGDRFKEGILINLSLSTLSQVIKQLSEKPDQFINYRNSKLTRLLQNSLGGNAVTAIICTVTPTSQRETLSTLNFASRAKTIKNDPKKNEILTDQAVLKQYANQIKKLSEELQASKAQGKELEEKTKQNENLKKQIEALKANFVSHAVEVEAKTKARRETWGGRADTLFFQRVGRRNQPFLDLPNIFEEDLETDAESPELVPTFKKTRDSRSSKSSLSRLSCSSVCSSVNTSKNILTVATQTDDEELLEQNTTIDEALTIVSEFKCQLTTLEREFSELTEYTTFEKQILKAENELQVETEALKTENSILRKALASKTLPLKPDQEITNKYCVHQSTQITPIKSKEFRTEYSSYEAVNEHYVHQHTQVTPTKSIEFSTQCRIINEHVHQFTQVTPAKPKQFSSQYSECKIIGEVAEHSRPNMSKEFSSQYSQCKIMEEVAHQHTQVSPIRSKDFSSQFSRWKVIEEFVHQHTQVTPVKSKEFSTQCSKWEVTDGNCVHQFSQVTPVKSTETSTQLNRCEMIDECVHQHTQVTPVKSKEFSTQCSKWEVTDDNCVHQFSQVTPVKSTETSTQLNRCEMVDECVQTTENRDADEKDKLNIQLKNEIKDLKDRINILEKINKDLDEDLDELYKARSEWRDSIEQQYSAPWKARTEMLLKDLEEKYEKELLDQEKKFNENLQAKLKELKYENSRQLHDLREEMANLRQLHKQELSAIISEKEILETEHREKVQGLVEKGNSKINEMKKHNSTLKVYVRHYLEEIEKLKQVENNPSSNQSKAVQIWKEKFNEVSECNVSLERKCFAEQQKNAEFKEQINKLKSELKLVNDKLQMSNDNKQNASKELEKVNKELLHELDQKKAMILSLQSNNGSMVQEMKKLRELLSKAESKCKNSKDLRQENLEKIEEKKDRKNRISTSEVASENHMVRQKSTEGPETPQQNNNVNYQTPDQNALLCVGGGSGPANMVKTFWLEGIVHKKDKEIAKLREEISNHRTRINVLTLQLKSGAKPIEAKRTEDIKLEAARTPLSPLKEPDENVTVQLKSLHPYSGGAVPKVPRKAKEKSNGIRSHEKPYGSTGMKENAPTKPNTPVDRHLPTSQPSENKNEIKTPYDVLNMISEPECKQQ